MSAWIHMVPLEDASGELAEMYELVKTPHGTVDNVMKAHSLRPHTMRGHVVLYRSVLHHDGNTVPLWFLETVASYVSIINACAYSLTHHWHNAAALIGEPGRAAAVRAALDARAPEQVFEGKELELLRYAGKLTATPGDMTRADWDAMKAAGADVMAAPTACALASRSACAAANRPMKCRVRWRRAGSTGRPRRRQRCCTDAAAPAIRSRVAASGKRAKK